MPIYEQKPLSEYITNDESEKLFGNMVEAVYTIMSNGMDDLECDESIPDAFYSTELYMHFRVAYRHIHNCRILLYIATHQNQGNKYVRSESDYLDKLTAAQVNQILTQ